MLKTGLTAEEIEGGVIIYIMYRTKTDKCLIAKRKLPNLTARLGNFRFI